MIVRIGRALVRCRWGMLRWLIAAFLFWCLWADGGARLARLELSAMPNTDFAAESRALREEGRFGESLTAAEAGLALTQSPTARAELASERERTIEAQGSWLRRARDVGLGALTGPGGEEGDEYATLERIGGAIAADLFVLGDVRDLILQGLKAARGEDVDPVIAALSAVGLVTTLAPEGDWIPSLLKSARKLGALSKQLTDFLIHAARRGDTKALGAFMHDVRTLAGRGSPASAVRLLRLADEPAEVARIAGFVERRGAAGIKAMEFGGRPAARVLAEADLAGDAGAALRAEETLVRASAKGPAMRGWLERGGWRRLVRPHPLIGLTKGLYKGNISAFIQRALQSIDGAAWWVMGALAAWAVFEGWMIVSRVRWAIAANVDAKR